MSAERAALQATDPREHSATKPRGEHSGRPILDREVDRPHVCFVSMGVYPILVGSTTIESAGGAELQQVVLARMLKDDGYRVSVLTADHGQPDVVICDGIEIHRVPAPGTRGVAGLRFISPHMSDVVKGLDQIDPDIIYFRVAGFRAAAVAWYARTRGKRFVYSCASDREFEGRQVSKLPRRDEFLFRAAIRAADGVLVQNLRQADSLRTHFSRVAELAPNCYAEEAAQRSRFGGDVLWVGTFKPVKRPELFIELARRLPALRFVMVGGPDHPNDPDQTYFQSMRAAARELPNLDFVGFVPVVSVAAYFDSASFLVNTSDSEGFPNTFLQAWIRGIPSLSFVRPEVIPGETGTLPCCDMNDLATRLSHLAGDATAWQRASDICYEHFSNVHSVGTALGRYRRFFGNLMDSPRLRREAARRRAHR